MTDKNDPDKKIEGADSTQDQEIIELQEETFVASQEDEEIIDLLEAVDEPEVEDIKESVSTEEAKSAEEIVTVTETMSDLPQEIEEIGEPIHMTADTSREAEDLTDLKDDLLEEPSELDDEFGKDVAFDKDLSDDFVDSLGMELDAKEDVSEDLLDTEKVSDAQMEAALERVIKKMFYEKIDGILVEVIEKTVTRELERLKNILLEDAAGNEK